MSADKLGQFIVMTCKKATWLLTVREDRPLTQHERFQLKLHLEDCSLCANYQVQTSLIARAVENISLPLSSKPSEKLKQQLRTILSRKNDSL